MANRPEVIYTRLSLGDGTITARIVPSIEEARYFWDAPRHTTRDYELHLFLEGSADLVVHNESYIMEKNTALLIAPGIPHSGFNRPEPFDHYFLHFHVEGTELSARLQQTIPSHTAFSVPEDIIRLTRDILQELHNETYYHWEVVQSLVQVLILKILRMADVAVKNVDKYRINEAMERRSLIAEFFRADLPYGSDKKQLSTLLKLSERQLSRFLEDEYGNSFSEMMMQCRMEQGAWLLQTTERPVYEIAEALGYQSLSAFYKAFRTWHGIPPTQYRKQYRSNLPKQQ